MSEIISYLIYLAYNNQQYVTSAWFHTSFTCEFERTESPRNNLVVFDGHMYVCNKTVFYVVTQVR